MRGAGIREKGNAEKQIPRGNDRKKSKNNCCGRRVGLGDLTVGDVGMEA
jgi:hypothetical protein